ncbi:hypothetical protein I7I53_06129 [Histoplasma capsulatum var. duboisii H88]|uniref:Uncharacterized protein n=1 Tax=Ajellomyces capsulatus (strain H88) TaxID=544711 RepID=A0A8A1LAE7_AJEC8|nr:hypothetical protein I7I53_06129 [Histoplasma capsulatum var. duboisii H88]
MLFEYSLPLNCPVDPEYLPTDGKAITVLAMQMGRALLMHDYSHVSKTCRSVTPAEAEAMRLASKHTSALLSKISYPLFGDTSGDIGIAIVPRSSLDKH